MTQQDWASRLAQITASQVRRYRELREMSAQQLAEACADLGHPIQRSVIANLENGRRGQVSVAEVIVLAVALKVPPIYLIYPCGLVEDMEGAPGLVSDPYEWALWFSGEFRDAVQGQVQASNEEMPLDYMRDLIPVLQTLRELRGEIKKFEDQNEYELTAYDEAERLSRAAAERYEISVRQQHDLLDSLQLIPFGSDEYQQVREEMEKAKEELDRARSASDVARARLSKLVTARAMYDRMQQERIAEEMRVHYLVDSMRKQRWSIPDFGEEFAEVMKEGAEIVPPKRTVRRPRKRGGGSVEIGG
ncbi:helix-turn-helix domain-containing protein [Streptomyces sp. MS191]|uniref:helix-turn-helix domain-containing protein n=1 Tax=Streptomyces sp. ms191 TaxID=1827978 RepID=UPI0011CD9D8B|nr:helix-turn-helix transcriptional regulator [Streptomyces sp. ms191]